MNYKLHLGGYVYILFAVPRKIKHAIEQYFIRFISIISWQTSNSYQLFFSNSLRGNLTNASSVETVLTHCPSQ